VVVVGYGTSKEKRCNRLYFLLKEMPLLILPPSFESQLAGRAAGVGQQI
jgi:hypothetical protein